MTTSRRNVLAFAAALVISPIVAYGASEPFESRAFEAALAEGGPVLVEVYAPWCPVCRAQTVILTDLAAEPQYSALRIIKVDFDSQKDVVRAFGAQFQSTLILFVGGAEVARSVGDTSPASIASMLGKAL